MTEVKCSRCKTDWPQHKVCPACGYVRFECPGCSRKYRAVAGSSGRHFSCRGCGVPVVVPVVASEPKPDTPIQPAPEEGYLIFGGRKVGCHYCNSYNLFANRGDIVTCRSCKKAILVPTAARTQPIAAKPIAVKTAPRPSAKWLQTREDWVDAMKVLLMSLSALVGIVGFGWCTVSYFTRPPTPPTPPRYEFGKPGFEALDNLTHHPATGRPLAEQEKIEMQRAIERFNEAERNRPGRK